MPWPRQYNHISRQCTGKAAEMPACQILGKFEIKTICMAEKICMLFDLLSLTGISFVEKLQEKHKRAAVYAPEAF